MNHCNFDIAFFDSGLYVSLDSFYHNLGLKASYKTKWIKRRVPLMYSHQGKTYITFDAAKELMLSNRFNNVRTAMITYAALVDSVSNCHIDNLQKRVEALASRAIEAEKTFEFYFEQEWPV